MIKSMTGYGKAEIQINNKKIIAEVRSLNSKQCDLSVRFPAAYRPVEQELRSEASRRLQRGKIDIFINCETVEGADTVSIDKKAFAGYYRQLGEIAKENYIDWGGNTLNAASFLAILRLPEVVQNGTADIPEEELDALKKVVSEAMDCLNKFREQEGEILMADMLERIAAIERLKNELEPFEAPRAEAVKKRIREHIEALQIPLDSNRLEQEMVFYIEKFDITEEKVRLQNHCDYFRQVAREEENPGRKLGFIAQEIGREINTTGSKANDVNIQKLVVQMKDELEKIKEQLLNLL